MDHSTQLNLLNLSTKDEIDLPRDTRGVHVQARNREQQKLEVLLGKGERFVVFPPSSLVPFLQTCLIILILQLYLSVP